MRTNEGGGGGWGSGAIDTCFAAFSLSRVGVDLECWWLWKRKRSLLVVVVVVGLVFDTPRCGSDLTHDCWTLGSERLLFVLFDSDDGWFATARVGDSVPVVSPPACALSVRGMCCNSGAVGAAGVEEIVSFRCRMSRLWLRLTIPSKPSSNTKRTHTRSYTTLPRRRCFILLLGYRTEILAPPLASSQA